MRNLASQQNFISSKTGDKPVDKVVYHIGMRKKIEQKSTFFKRNVKKPIVLSFFSGCGGLDEGFEAAGFQIPLAIESQEYATNTYRVNFPKTKVMGPPDHQGDISKLTGKEILKYAGLRRGEVDAIIGGPPCQPFSVAAAQRFLKTDSKFKRLGFQDKKRGTLLVKFVKIILDIQPRFFLIENVPGIATIDDGKQVALVRKMVEAEGYHFSGPYVVNVADFGIPQNRKRALFIGSKKIKDFGIPKSTLPSASVAQALVGVTGNLPNHQTRIHDQKTLARYTKLKIGEREPLGRVDRLDPFKPSKTIIAGGSNGGGRSHLHPYVARTLSVRESARLQTFNDNFVFTGAIARQFTQVGNAVPPLFAEIIARYVLEKEFGIKKTGAYKNGAILQKNLSAFKADKIVQRQASTELGSLYNDVPSTERRVRFEENTPSALRLQI